MGSGCAKTVQVLRKNTSDEQPESNMGEEGREVRRESMGPRKMKGG